MALLTLALCLNGCFFLPDFLLVKSPDEEAELRLEVVDNAPKVLHEPEFPQEAEFSEYDTRSATRNVLAMDRFLVTKVHRGPVNALAASQDGTLAVSGGQDGRVVLSRLIRQRSAAPGGKKFATRRFIETQELLTSSRPITALAISPDAKKILVAQFSGVAIFDLEKHEITASLTRIKGRILAVAWDPRAELAAIGRANGDVFIWKVNPGRWSESDSLDSVERYEAGSSPIVAIQFHPSGRSFFAAERAGGVVFWRLLRTERELGLLDDNAQVDKSRRGRRAVRLGPVVGTVEDIWLSHNADHLFASVSDGNIYRWKIRGLKPEQPLAVGTDSVFSLRGLLVPVPGESYETVPLVVTSGRGQRLKFWCKNPPPQPPPSVVDIVPSEPETDEAGAKSPEPAAAQVAPPAGFVGQSRLFPNPLTIVRGGMRSPLLWAAEKTGNLLSFDADSLLRDPDWRRDAQRCLSDSPQPADGSSAPRYSGSDEILTKPDEAGSAYTAKVTPTLDPWNR